MAKLNFNQVQGGGDNNLLINGGFDVWQRGTSFAGGVYTADRFVWGSGGSTCAIARQNHTLGQTDVPGNPVYFMSNNVTASSGTSAAVTMQQRMEDVRRLAGKTVTLSFYAKSATAPSISVEIEQYYGSGGSATEQVFAPAAMTLSSSWQKFTLTVDIPSITGKTVGGGLDHYTNIRIWCSAGTTYASRANSIGVQTGYFQFSNMKLEEGAVATPYVSRLTAEELALCQRYYQTVRAYIRFMAERAAATFSYTIPLPVPMRTTPTSTTGSVSNTNVTSYSPTINSTYILPYVWSVTTGSTIYGCMHYLDAEL